MLKMGDMVGPRYTAAKISAISNLFVFFFFFFDTLVIMCYTGRPHYTGFRGPSVFGITVLQLQKYVLISHINSL